MQEADLGILRRKEELVSLQVSYKLSKSGQLSKKISLKWAGNCFTKKTFCRKALVSYGLDNKNDKLDLKSLIKIFCRTALVDEEMLFGRSIRLLCRCRRKT